MEVNNRFLYQEKATDVLSFHVKLQYKHIKRIDYIVNTDKCDYCLMVCYIAIQGINSTI